MPQGIAGVQLMASAIVGVKRLSLWAEFMGSFAMVSMPSFTAAEVSVQKPSFTAAE